MPTPAVFADEMTVPTREPATCIFREVEIGVQLTAAERDRGTGSGKRLCTMPSAPAFWIDSNAAVNMVNRPIEDALLSC